MSTELVAIHLSEPCIALGRVLEVMFSIKETEIFKLYFEKSSVLSAELTTDAVILLSMLKR